MNIPKRLKKEWNIKDETYTVKYVKSIEGDKDTLGLCDPGSHEILIAKGQTRAQLFRTFIHEVVHALDMEHDIGLSHPAVYKLEKAISDFLLTNF